jgi:hypothetical protein
MSRLPLETLSTVVQEVLRAVAFAFGDPCAPQELPDCEAAPLKARLRFDGLVSGELRLAAPPGLCAELAGDAMSLAADAVGGEQIEDSLKELLNVIGGNWLSAAYGEEPVFALSPPEAETIDLTEWERLRRDPSSLGLVFDDRPLIVNLCLT